jgi:hypothetical protein
VQQGALAWPVVVLQMALMGPVPHCPLGPLLNGKEAKGTVALARRGLALSHLWADAAGWFTGTIAYEQHLLQARDRLLGPANNHGIPDRSAVAQHMLVDGL